MYDGVGRELDELLLQVSVLKGPNGKLLRQLPAGNWSRDGHSDEYGCQTKLHSAAMPSGSDRGPQYPSVAYPGGSRSRQDVVGAVLLFAIDCIYPKIVVLNVLLFQLRAARNSSPHFMCSTSGQW